MSQILTRLREERAAIVAAASAVVDPAAAENRQLSESEQQAFNGLSSKLDEIDQRIGGIVENERRAKEAEDAFNKLNGRAAGTGNRNAPSLLPTADTLAALHAAVTNRSSVRIDAADVEARAAVLTTDTGASALASSLVLGVREPRRIVTAAGIPSQPVSGVESVKFPVFGSADAAGIAAEGATKPEYDDISPGSVTPQMISLWTDVSRQALLTMPAFEARLRNVLSGRVANREDQLLLATVTATSGILNPTGTLGPDLVLDAAAAVAAGDHGMEPSLVAVNPADVSTLLGTSVGTGGSASPEFAAFLPRIHGMTVYPTTHVAAGEAVVGAWSSARFIVGLAPTFLVDGVSAIKNNLVTILLEEAVGLAIDEPTAFAHITAA